MLVICNGSTTQAFKLSEEELSLGDIVQLKVKNNEVVLSKSDGSAPLGILMNISSIRDEGTVSYGRSNIITDNFVLSAAYPLNSNLYVIDGKFTTERPNPLYPAIAMVIKPPTVMDVTLHCIWF